MDLRQQLVFAMDAAVARDVVELVALARLNWSLIDVHVLQFLGQRVAQVQMADQWARQDAESQRRVDVQMSIITGSSSSGSTPSAYRDPRGPAFAAVHQMATLAAMHQGQPAPETPPALAAIAMAILDGSMPIKKAFELMVETAPPAQRMALTGMRVVAAIPWLGEKLIAPIVRGSAAGAVSLEDLARLYPRAVFQAPAEARPVAPTTRVAEPGRDASLVEVLLHQASSGAPGDAEENIRQALVAASLTTAIDDDIVVLHHLLKYAAKMELSPNVVRTAVALVDSLKNRPERRDDVAFMTAWMLDVIGSVKLVDELGDTLIGAARIVLESELTATSRTMLASNAANMAVRRGRVDDALEILDLADPHVNEPPQRLELELIRADIRFAADEREDAVAALQSFLTNNPALPPNLRRRAIEKLMVIWPSGVVGLQPRIDEVMKLYEGAGEPERTGGLVNCFMALQKSGLSNDRKRSLELVDRIDLAKARDQLPPNLQKLFDLATKDFPLLVAQVRAQP